MVFQYQSYAAPILPPTDCGCPADTPFTLTGTGVLTVEGCPPVNVTFTIHAIPTPPNPEPPPNPLQLTVPPNQTVQTSGSSAQVFYPPASTTGGVPPVSISYSHPSGSIFPAGTTTVTVTAQSLDNQTVVKTFTVTVQVVTIPVVLSIVRATASPTANPTVQWTVTFSESVTGVTLSAFSLAASGVSGAAIQSLAGTGAVYTVTATTGSGGGTLGLNLSTTTGILNGTQQPLAGPFTGEIYAIDRTAPVCLSLTRLDGNPTPQAVIRWRATFSESVTGLTSANFALVPAGGVTGGAVQSITGSGTIFTVQVSNFHDTGTLGLNFVASAAVVDGVGNPCVTNLTGEVYTITEDFPTGLTGFVPNPTHTTIANGDYHNPAIWNTGTVPGAQHWAQIDHTVTVAGSLIEIWTLYISETGSLIADKSGGGSLDLVITNKAYTDIEQYETGIIIRGTIDLDGIPRTRTTRLAGALAAGVASVPLAATPSNWAAGDRLVFPDTRAYAILFEFEAGQFFPEVGTIQSIVGSTATLTGGLVKVRSTAREANGTVRRTTPIGNLTSNVRIRSANPAGVRGHLIASDHGHVRLDHVAIVDFGRTTNAPIHTTTNHIGRYALHLHHIHHDAGSWVRDCVIERSLLWGITIHHTNQQTITGNLVYDSVGAGIMTEDGTEVDNIITDNLVIKVTGDGGRGDERQPQNEWGRNGSGVWTQGPNNFILRNIAANCLVDGFGTWGLGPDPVIRSGYFVDNEAVCCVQGISPWYLGSTSEDSYITNFFEWHCRRTFYSYPTIRMIWQNVWGLGDPAIIPAIWYAQVGGWWGDYDTHLCQVVGGSIQNKRGGIALPYGISARLASIAPTAARTNTIDGVSFANNQSGDVTLQQIDLSYPAGGQPPFDAVVRNTLHSATHPSENHLVCLPPQTLNGSANANVVSRQRFDVQNYQGVASDDFRLYMGLQAANVVVPASQGMLIGAPVAGLTNAQLWAQFGLAVAGAVAPAGTTSRTKIVGLVEAV